MRCSPAVIPIRSRASARTGRPVSSFAPCCPARKACMRCRRKAPNSARSRASIAPAASRGRSRATAAPHYLLAIDWPDARQVIDDAYAFGTLLDDAVLARFSAGDPAAVLDCSARRPRASTTPTACASRSGRRTRSACRWSAISTAGTAAAIRCGCGGRRACGAVRAGHRRGRVLQVRGARGRRPPHKADPVHARPRRRRARRRSSPTSRRSTRSRGTTTAGRARPHADRYRVPWSIYEVHAESWQRVPEEMNRSATWDELAERLIPYVQGMGFTHVEFMPIAEYPFGGSWATSRSRSSRRPRASGRSTVSRASSTARMRPASACSSTVPAHFPDDPHGLAQFDGTALYEHADPREGLHPDWHTCVFNVGRTEVGAFSPRRRSRGRAGITSTVSASTRSRRCCTATIRVRKANGCRTHGGRENLESVAFLRMLNDTLHGAAAPAGVVTVAEESTAWPGVTAPTGDGGLGFDFGTWAGCTTRSRICARTRCIAAITTTG